MIQQFCQDVATTQALAEQAIAVCREHGFAYYLARARILRGWAYARQDGGEEAIGQIRAGLEALLATEAGVRELYYLALLAEAQARAGQVDAGLSALAEALTKAVRREDRWYEAEIHRLGGELLRQTQISESEVEACFQQAVEVARQQQGRLLELRAAMSLSRLWQSQGQIEAAHDLLAETHERCSEGFDTPVLQQATRLLDELK